jgi:hypothetical protein
MRLETVMLQPGDKALPDGGVIFDEKNVTFAHVNLSK